MLVHVYSLTRDRTRCSVIYPKWAPGERQFCVRLYQLLPSPPPSNISLGRSLARSLGRLGRSLGRSTRSVDSVGRLGRSARLRYNIFYYIQYSVFSIQCDCAHILPIAHVTVAHTWRYNMCRMHMQLLVLSARSVGSVGRLRGSARSVSSLRRLAPLYSVAPALTRAAHRHRREVLVQAGDGWWRLRFDVHAFLFNLPTHTHTHVHAQQR